jgi:integrase
VRRKYKNRNIPKGIWITKEGYVKIKIYEDGRRIVRSVGRVSEPGSIDLAVARLNQIREEIRLGKFNIEGAARRITMEEAMKIYWEFHGQTKCKSYKTIRKHLETFFSCRFLDSITYLDVQKYRNWRANQIYKGKPIKSSTINRDHTALTHLFNLLKELKRIGKIRNVKLPTENPGSQVRKISERQFRRTRVLTEEEFKRLMSHADYELKRILLGAIHSTLRLKNLKELTLDNVNWTTNCLEGTQSKVRGGREYRIPINKPLKSIIDSAPGRNIFDFGNFRKRFEAARKKAGLIDFEFKDLRRTGARTMLDIGVDLAAVMRYLGHADITTTQVYVPPTDKAMRTAGELLGSRFTHNFQEKQRQGKKAESRYYVSSAVFSVN